MRTVCVVDGGSVHVTARIIGPYINDIKMPLREPSSLGLASRAWIVSGSRPRPRSREAKIGGGAIMSARLALPG